jgi:hypothetical protein
MGNAYNERRQNSYHHHWNIFIETSKDFSYVFNSAPESYNRVQNKQKGALLLLPTLIHPRLLVLIQFDKNG